MVSVERGDRGGDRLWAQSPLGGWRCSEVSSGGKDGVSCHLGPQLGVSGEPCHPGLSPAGPGLHRKEVSKADAAKQPSQHVC